MKPVVLIAGIPGAGKTTLAEGLRDAFGGVLVSTGDIARLVDPAGVSAGGMADEASFRDAFMDMLAIRRRLAEPSMLVLDGIPRTLEQLSYVKGLEYHLLAVTCRPDIARDRLLRRGRSDDTPEIIERRIEEQSRLLEIDKAGGWLYEAATWHATVNTDYKQPDAILAGFVAYLRGEKRDAA